MVRVRVVEGSCWPCKKRRTRCDLIKPVCRRCVQAGVLCNYSTQLIRWSARPSVRDVPALYQITGLGQNGLMLSEQRALDYFHSRVWPLLQSSEVVCPPPLPVALEHRIVLLATCLLAESHQLLQGGHQHGSVLSMKRLQCLAAIKSEVDCCCAGSRPRSLLVLLFAVLLLHLHDGFMEPHSADASTASHHQGVVAILVQLGGIDQVLRSSPESMQMLLAEFASADLTTAILQGTAPSYPPSIWQAIDEGAVWWGRDPYRRQSLATVLREMSAMAFYYDSIANGLVELSMDEVRIFEAFFNSEYTLHTPCSMDNEEVCSAERSTSNDDADAVHALALIQSFQHAALIFLYRAVCRLPLRNPLVQYHVQSCLNSISEIEKPSRVLHCVIFPLCVAGAHAQTSEDQQAVVEMLAYIRGSMRFASIGAIIDCMGAIWGEQPLDITWTELFSGLGSHVLVL